MDAFRGKKTYQYSSIVIGHQNLGEKQFFIRPQLIQPRRYAVNKDGKIIKAEAGYSKMYVVPTPSLYEEPVVLWNSDGVWLSQLGTRHLAAINAIKKFLSAAEYWKCLVVWHSRSCNSSKGTDAHGEHIHVICKSPMAQVSRHALYRTAQRKVDACGGYMKSSHVKGNYRGLLAYLTKGERFFLGSNDSRLLKDFNDAIEMEEMDQSKLQWSLEEEVITPEQSLDYQDLPDPFKNLSQKVYTGLNERRNNAAVATLDVPDDTLDQESIQTQPGPSSSSSSSSSQSVGGRPLLGKPSVGNVAFEEEIVWPLTLTKHQIDAPGHLNNEKMAQTVVYMTELVKKYPQAKSLTDMITSLTPESTEWRAVCTVAGASNGQKIFQIAKSQVTKENQEKPVMEQIKALPDVMKDYMTPHHSLAMLNAWLLEQAISPRYWYCLMNMLLRGLAIKKIGIYLHGESNSGKTMLSNSTWDCLASIVGYTTRDNFMFQDCAGKKIVVAEECAITQGNKDKFKSLMSGSQTTCERKNKEPGFCKAELVMMNSNVKIQHNLPQEDVKTFKTRMYEFNDLRKSTVLKDCYGLFHPKMYTLAEEATDDEIMLIQQNDRDEFSMTEPIQPRDMCAHECVYTQSWEHTDVEIEKGIEAKRQKLECEEEMMSRRSDSSEAEEEESENEHEPPKKKIKGEQFHEEHFKLYDKRAILDNDDNTQQEWARTAGSPRPPSPPIIDEVDQETGEVYCSADKITVYEYKPNVYQSSWLQCGSTVWDVTRSHLWDNTEKPCVNRRNGTGSRESTESLNESIESMEIN